MKTPSILKLLCLLSCLSCFESLYGMTLIRIKDASVVESETLLKQGKILIFTELHCPACQQLPSDLAKCPEKILDRLLWVSLDSPAKVQQWAQNLDPLFPGLYAAKNPQRAHRLISATPSIWTSCKKSAGPVDCHSLNQRLLCFEPGKLESM